MDILRYILAGVFVAMGVGIWASAKVDRSAALYLGAFCYAGSGAVSFATGSWWPLPIGFVLAMIVRAVLGDPSAPRQWTRRDSEKALEDAIRRTGRDFNGLLALTTGRDCGPRQTYMGPRCIAMDAFSTVNVVMNLYTVVYDLYDGLHSVEHWRSAVAYPLVEDQVGDAVLRTMMPSLPPGFLEFNYWVIDGASRRAAVSIAFAENRIVNFNLQVFPKEVFKKRAVWQTLKTRLLPYVAAKASAGWELAPDGLVARDSKRRIVHYARVNLIKPITLSVSLMAEEFAGV